MKNEKDNEDWLSEIKDVKKLGKTKSKVKLHQNHNQKITHIDTPKVEKIYFSNNEKSYFKEFPIINCDKYLYKKIIKGQIKEDIIYDLHGIYIDDVYEHLLQLINRAYINKQKIILIITGKSYKREQSDIPTIRKETIKLLCYTHLSEYINSMFHPNENKGGTGAIILVLKNIDKNL